MIRFSLLFSLLFAVFASPLVVLALYSLSSSWSYPQIIPVQLDWRSYAYLAGHFRDISASLLFSCVYSLAAVTLTLAMTILPARLFARTDMAGKTLLEGLLLAPALVPPMAFAMGAHYIFLHLGLADTFAGVVLILSLYSYPYMLRALTAGFLAQDRNYTLCAQNMGASSFRILVAVELPLLLPAIVAGGIIVFLVSFSEYFLVFLIGGGIVPSYSGYIFPLLNSSDKSVASLLTLLFLLPPIFFFVLIDRLIYRLYRQRGLL